MDQSSARRSALMSIRPQFVAGILNGTKRVEFRKRRLAADIDSVVIYSTSPVMAVVGEFAVAEQVVGTPDELWERFASVAGIDAAGFFDYFANTTQAVGIVIDSVRTYPDPKSLADVDPGARPPQSVKYLLSA